MTFSLLLLLLLLLLLIPVPFPVRLIGCVGHGPAASPLHPHQRHHGLPEGLTGVLLPHGGAGTQPHEYRGVSGVWGEREGTEEGGNEIFHVWGFAKTL